MQRMILVDNGSRHADAVLNLHRLARLIYCMTGFGQSDPIYIEPTELGTRLVPLAVFVLTDKNQIVCFVAK